MSWKFKFGEDMCETRTERDQRIAHYQAELLKTPARDVTSSCHCTASGSEYDPCCCPVSYSPNSRYAELERKLKTLAQMTFCSCGSALTGKPFCADCGSKATAQLSAHSNCPHWKAGIPFCGSCGQPTLPNQPQK